MQYVYEQIVEQIKNCKNLTFVSGTISKCKKYTREGGTDYALCFFVNKGSLSFSINLNFEHQNLSSIAIKKLTTNEFFIVCEEGSEDNLSAILKMLNDCNLNDCNLPTKRKSISFGSFFKKSK